MIAIIPARGGSKRIPGKNLVPFFGHPMLAYTIAAARNSGLFERVIVSTDDTEITKVALSYGAEVIPRPVELAQDSSSLVDVTLHVLNSLRDKKNSHEAFCQLMPNCPLRRSEDIKEHMKEFIQQKRQFQISVVPYRGVYPHWSLEFDKDNLGKWHFGEHLMVSQNLPPLVCPTGAIWWANTNSFLQQHKFYGDPSHVQMMDGNRGMDIDTTEELELSELLVRGLKDRDGINPLEPIS